MGGETEEDPPNHNTDQIWGNYRPSSHHKPGNTDHGRSLQTTHSSQRNAHIFKHTNNNGDENDLFFLGAKIEVMGGSTYYNFNSSVMVLMQIDM